MYRISCFLDVLLAILALYFTPPCVKSVIGLALGKKENKLKSNIIIGSFQLQLYNGLGLASERSRKSRPVKWGFE